MNTHGNWFSPYQSEVECLNAKIHTLSDLDSFLDKRPANVIIIGDNKEWTASFFANLNSAVPKEFLTKYINKLNDDKLLYGYEVIVLFSIQNIVKYSCKAACSDPIVSLCLWSLIDQRKSIIGLINDPTQVVVSLCVVADKVADNSGNIELADIIISNVSDFILSNGDDPVFTISEWINKGIELKSNVPNGVEILQSIFDKNDTRTLGGVKLSRTIFETLVTECCKLSYSKNDIKCKDIGTEMIYNHALSIIKTTEDTEELPGKLVKLKLATTGISLTEFVTIVISAFKFFNKDGTEAINNMTELLQNLDPSKYDIDGSEVHAEKTVVIEPDEVATESLSAYTIFGIGVLAVCAILCGCDAISKTPLAKKMIEKKQKTLNDKNIAEAAKKVKFMSETELATYRNNYDTTVKYAKSLIPTACKKFDISPNHIVISKPEWGKKTDSCSILRSVIESVDAHETERPDGSNKTYDTMQYIADQLAAEIKKTKTKSNVEIDLDGDKYDYYIFLKYVGPMTGEAPEWWKKQTSVKPTTESADDIAIEEALSEIEFLQTIKTPRVYYTPNIAFQRVNKLGGKLRIIPATEASDKTLKNADKRIEQSSHMANAQAKGYKMYKDYKTNEDKIDSQLTKIVKSLGNKVFNTDKDKARNDIIEGNHPTFLKVLKSLFAGYAIFNVNKVFAVLLLVTRYYTSKHVKTGERKKILIELKNEMKIVDEKINDAAAAGDKKAKYTLMRQKNNLESTYNKIESSFRTSPDAALKAANNAIAESRGGE